MPDTSRRIVIAFCVAGLAWAVGEGLHIPVWRTWEPIDRADMALLAFIATYLATLPTRAGSDYHAGKDARAHGAQDG